ncbi:MAG: hypothetical protein KDE32_01115 [Novosphingobium sp.]|nr:hypothetical protein [Novosphingobium sp.]
MLEEARRGEVAALLKPASRPIEIDRPFARGQRQRILARQSGDHGSVVCPEPRGISCNAT